MIVLEMRSILKLYESCNGVLVAWENANEDNCGLLKIPTSEDLILMIESEIKLMSGFDDNYIITRIHVRSKVNFIFTS